MRTDEIKKAQQEAQSRAYDRQHEILKLAGMLVDRMSIDWHPHARNLIRDTVYDMLNWEMPGAQLRKLLAKEAQDA